MIVSHKYKFVIAVPCGLNAADWLTRVAEEGPEGYLEIVGWANGVCIPEGCESYTRYFVDSPHHRLPQLWSGRVGTPWEGPAKVQGDVEEWLKWYCFSMRRKYLEVAMESSPNGWGMRGTDGDWVYFEHPKTLLRTFAGIGNSPKGEDAPWGRSQPVVLKMEEYSRGWRELIKNVAPRGIGRTDMDDDQRDTVDLLRWHIPSMHQFYELDRDLVSMFLGEGAWEYKHQKGIATLEI